MFDFARLKLTVWYVFILMCVSFLFSAAFYQVSTREIQLLINRIEYDESRGDAIIFKRPHLPPHILSLDELYEVKSRIAINLMIINIGILLVAGGASYFLAGKTLLPIKQMVDEQNQFISDASHELRTPIAVLRAEMEASLLEKKITSTQARTLILSNLEELTTLQELANRLLRLAQAPTSKTRSTDTVSIVEVLDKALKKVAILAKEKSITINSSHLGKTDKLIVKGDLAELTEVFVILLDNAIKYSPSKSQIALNTKKTKSKLQVIVTDQGIGISKADLPHIFKRFYRADKSRSQAEGHGLGLAIAHSIITGHAGSITAMSTNNKGATFIVELPLY
jgi:signal transduction histidine kinase